MAAHEPPLPRGARTPRSSEVAEVTTSQLGGRTILGQETPDLLEPHSKGEVSGGENYLTEVPAEVSFHLELIIEREFSPLSQAVCKLKPNFQPNPLRSAKIKCKGWGICQLAH